MCSYLVQNRIIRANIFASAACASLVILLTIATHGNTRFSQGSEMVDAISGTTNYNSIGWRSLTLSVKKSGCMATVREKETLTKSNLHMACRINHDSNFLWQHSLSDALRVKICTCHVGVEAGMCLQREETRGVGWMMMHKFFWEWLNVPV